MCFGVLSQSIFGAEMAMRAVQDSEGLPIAVQLVALPWREELCLRAMLELEEAGDSRVMSGDFIGKKSKRFPKTPQRVCSRYIVI